MRRWFQGRPAATMPYWIQRADYTSTDFKPVTLAAAQTVLRAHNWSAELAYESSLAESGKETCPPGIGFVANAGRFLHFCFSEDGSATCFFQNGAGTRHRENVLTSEQGRFLRLFYRGDDANLARAFENSQSALTGIWPEFVEALRGMGIAIAAVSGAGILLVAMLVGVVNTVEGVPLWETAGRMVSALPVVFSFKLLLAGSIFLFFGAITFAWIWLSKTGWQLSIEGREHTHNVLIAVGFAGLFVVLAAVTGNWDELPFQIGYTVGLFGALVWPLYVMGRHRRRQDRILDKIRAHYIFGTTSLMAGHDWSAGRRLKIIRNLEAHWRLGASRPMRVALLSYVLVTNTGLAFAGQVFSQHLGHYPKSKSLMDTLQLLWGTPWLLALVAGVAVLFSFPAFRDASQIHSRPWSEFYGDRLQQALNAGSGLAAAPQWEGPDLPKNVTARELLGLNVSFTKAELRQAWLRLARQLHPDRWTSSGSDVRTMKEAALKRVNAARDELMPLAL